MSTAKGEAGACAAAAASEFTIPGLLKGWRSLEEVVGGRRSGPRTPSENICICIAPPLLSSHPPSKTKPKITFEREDPSRGADSAPGEEGPAARWIKAGVPVWGRPGCRAPGPTAFQGHH